MMAWRFFINNSSKFKLKDLRNYITYFTGGDKKDFMNQELTQQEIAVQDGYTACFAFRDGQIYCTLNPDKGYSLALIEKQPCPCIITETIVYRIKTPEGIKGYAILNMKQDDDE